MTVTVGGRPCVRGIDVSRWQGRIDWQQVAQHRAFAVIKASGGDGGVYADQWYPANKASSAAAGIPTGAYHFLGAHTDGRAQARKFLEVTGGYTGHQLPPVLDVEHAGTPPHVVDGFLAELEAGMARRWTGPTGEKVAAVIYTGAPMAGMIQARWARMDLWLAAYLSPSYPRPGADVVALGLPDRFIPRAAWSAWSVWQWAGEDGRCPGVPGACDQNVATVEWFDRALGTPIPEPEEDIMATKDELREVVSALISEQDARIAATIGQKVDAILVNVDPVGVAAGTPGEGPSYLRTEVGAILALDQGASIVDPAEFADRVVELLGATLAAQVVAELGKRLG